ncbi:MAG: hypothetical protein KAU83_09575 [Bacteroidales bacterium]|nr:hypothetical protein [Bacteroidales bacterium]
MKKLLSIAICLVFIGNAFGQEKFTVPERTHEQKHKRTMYQFWSVFAAGINFAKSQDISPYEYGKYIGSLFAPSWNKENGFDGLVNGTIYNWENFKSDEDGQMVIKEKDDGSVIIDFPAAAWKKYLPEDNPYASFQEVLDCMQGILEPIADYMESTINLIVKDEWIIFTIKKK